MQLASMTSLAVLRGLSAWLLTLIILGHLARPVRSDAKPFMCYDCVDSIDKKCADQFDENAGKSFLINCNDESKIPRDADNKIKYQNATMCRKIVQYIEERYSIVRECAYTGDKVEGLKRSGNKGVKLYYYQCGTEKCNHGSSIFAAENSFVFSNLKTLLAVLVSFFVAFVWRI